MRYEDPKVERQGPTDDILDCRKESAKGVVLFWKEELRIRVALPTLGRMEDKVPRVLSNPCSVIWSCPYC